MDFNPWLICNFASFVMSMVITGVIIPQILLIAFRRQLFDGMEERKIHHGSVPRLGGIAFLPSILLTLAFVVGCSSLNTSWDIFQSIFVTSPVVITFALCALMVLYLVGMADDLVGVKYRAKFVAQIVASLFIVVSGLWINNLNGFCGVEDMSPVAGIILTVVVVVFIINSINLIDGIDGLASGLSGIALLCYGVMFFTLGRYLLAMLSFATLGSLVPFFYFNVMGEAIKKKKIFMGDTGTMTIGFILAFLSVEMSMTPTGIMPHVDPLVMAYAPLVIPGFDVVRVFAHRIRRKQNPFLPDRSHIHHKLLALGIHQRVVMILILVISLLYTIASLCMSMVMNVTFVLLIDFGSWIIINYFLTKAIHAYSERHGVNQQIYE